MDVGNTETDWNPVLAALCGGTVRGGECLCAR
jgi:hypothetical protein